MKEFIKELNINDFLIFFLGSVIVLPYKAYPLFIGHIYIHEIIIFIYFIVNVINIILKKDYKKIFKITKIQQVFLIYLIFIFFNYVFSMYGLKNYGGYDFINGLKIKINVLRGYLEFAIILFVFNYNIKNSSIKINGFLYYIMILAIWDMTIPLIRLGKYIDISRLITDPKFFMQFRAGIGRPANLGLPDGSSAIIFLGISNYLFFIVRKWYQRFILIFFYSISIIVIFVTYARIYIVGFIGILIFNILFVYKKKIRFIIISIFILFLLAGGYNSIRGRFLKRVYSNNDIGSGRFILLTEVNNIYIRNIYNLIYGVGAGNFFYYNKTGKINQHYDVGFSGPHNQLFTILTDFGILGYILFIYAVLFLFYKNYFLLRSISFKEQILRKNLLSLVVAFLAMGIAGDMFISYHPPMTHYLMFLWMFVAILGSGLEF